MTFIKLLFIISYMIYCSAETNRIACYSRPTPTLEPTLEPTSKPTRGHHTPLIRRLADRQNNFDTYATGNSPCITFEIKLETENLLPHNTQPDPASNIAIIGKAIAGITGGMVTIPSTPDEEDGEELTDYPDYIPWVLDPNCTIDNQMIDYYMPNREWSPEFEFLAEETDSGFVVKAEIITNDSIVYVFNIKKLMLHVKSSCSESIKISVGIYMNDMLIQGTRATKTIQAFTDQRHVFVLDETTTLSPGTRYEIRFKYTDYPYPDGCDFASFTSDALNPTRRRLAVAVDGEANPSSCVMGSNLARSAGMIAAVTAMCNENVNNRAELETGIFKQQCSDAAIGDHLLKTGSLSLYDMSTGDLTKFIDDFPAHEVQKPCIAVDETKLIIYAVGGYDNNTGEAVDYIQAYRFTDDTLTSGEILPYDGWRLDQPRYGTSCMIWPNDDDAKLVVVGGMARTSMEFENKMDWYNDIRTYSLPDPDDTDLFFAPSDPEFGTCKLRLPMSDMRLLLIDEHHLYMFGGKTHAQSKSFVQRLDLNTINSCTTVKEGMLLAEKKAMPMTDKVMFDEDNDGTEDACYMIFSGQSYLNGAIDSTENGLNFDLLQVFCNGRISSESFNGRRLVGVGVGPVGFTSYDLEKRKELGEKTQVRMRRYEYGLDGIWYNFSVSFELCYANNQELKSAVKYYDSVMDEKLKGEKWKQYKEDISEKILNCSLDAYEGWSNGFGAVNVWDLEKLSVRYDVTPSPTIKKHSKRRKSRNGDSDSDSDDCD